ncbi:Spectrin repeat superfamily Extracellular matrix-binding protein, putative [Babesia ovata]|uniref:Spectrin repeat superfamily Extracellular matrix-binding protein, putative n=1 Tax=Babesia ovata TaxID=189622 RepID=A0A2H6K6M3_9APIC|nr:Spectrin repeat superfamily Extracellular matrix-binding protein, putative [Babesia ovata]GBE58629.1 Spectrin repeat superfamily Extracellular matrix-binding protein, putative [Babesia ovata]
MGDTIQIRLHPRFPLVALFALPAAHRRRPPRRPEDTLPPALTSIAPHRRAVPPRRRTRWENSQRQVLLTIIVPSRVICVSLTHPPTQPLNHSTTHSTTHSLTHSPTHSPPHSPTHSLNHSLTNSPNHSLTHSPNHSLTHPLTHPLNHSTTQPLNHSTTHPLNHSTTHPLNHSTTHPLTHILTHSPTHSTTHSPNHPLTNSPTHSTTQPLNHSPTHSTTHSPNHPLTNSPTQPLTQPLNHSPTHPLNHSLNHSTTHPPTQPLTHPTTHSPTHPLNHPPTQPLTHSTTYSSNHSPTHSLNHSLNHSTTHSPTSFTGRFAPSPSPLHHLLRRHGNGEKGDGLDKLAEALKKLVGDAIEKAETSLSTRHSQLSCSKASGYRHCKYLDAKIAEAKKALNSEKLSETEKSKKESELSMLQSKKEKHYNEVHYLSDDARDNALKDIKERQNKLTELSKNLEIFTTPDDQCENLLSNLTDGLEKFLGYNKDFKGYDGSGIVYSDLDRLCDGVMAFLGGVLSGVKVKEWLDGYGKNIAELTTNVKDELTSLKHDVGGKYNSQIVADRNLEEQSKQWKNTVSDIYSKVYNIQNDRVDKLDSVLKGKLNAEIKVVKEAVQMLYDSAANAFFLGQVKQVDDELARQKENLETAVKKGTKKVQDTLDDEVNRILRNITNLYSKKDVQFTFIREAVQAATQHAREYYVKFNGEYKGKILQMFEDVKYGLRDVDKSSGAASGGKSKLRNDVNMIKTALEQIGSTLGKHVADLQRKIEEAELFRKLVLGKANDVHGALKAYTNTNTKTVIRENIELILEAKREIETVDKTLKGEAEKLSSWTTEASKVVKAANRKVDEIVTALKYEDNDDNFKSELDDIKNKADQLNSAYTKTQEHLVSVVEKVKGRDGDTGPLANLKVPNEISKFKLSSGDGWDLNSKIQGVTEQITTNVEGQVQQLLKNIKKYVDSIKGTSQVPAQQKGLTHIVSGVQTLAGLFKGKGFENKVGGWVMNILKEHPMKGLIERYVRHNESHIKEDKDKTLQRDKDGSQYYKGLNEKIAEKITNQLRPGIIHDAGEEVEQKLQELGQKTSSLQILLLSRRASRSLSRNLLLVVARQVAAEIQVFLDAYKIGNVDGALATASKLDSELGDAIRNYSGTALGGNISTQVKAIAEKVNDVNINTPLKELLKATAEKAIQKLHEALKNPVINELGGVTNDVPDVKDGDVRRLNGDISHAVGTIQGKLTAISKMVKDSSKQATIKGVVEDLDEMIKEGDGEYTLRSVSQKANVKRLTKIYDQLNDLQNNKLKDQPKAITKAVEAIQSEIRRLQGLLKGGNSDVNDDVILNLQKLEKTIGKTENGKPIAGSIQELHSKISELHTTEFTEQLSSTSSNSITSTIQNAIKGVVNVVTGLETMPEDVETKKAEVDELMGKLRHQLYTLQGNLNVINEKIDEADRALMDAINTVDTVVREEYVQIKQSVDQLRSQLLSAIKYALDKITIDVRILFTEQKRADLTALQKLVEKQSKKVNKIITDDLANGIKCLLWNMNTHHTQLPQIPIQIELNKAAEYLQWYLDPIVKYVDCQHRPNQKTDRGASKKPKSPDDDPQVSSVYEFYAIISSFLRLLLGSNNFNHKAIEKIYEADVAIRRFTPSKFSSTSSNTLLDIVKSGFRAFVEQLKKVYVSSYSGVTDTFNWNGDKNSEKCAKVCLTVLETLFYDFNSLSKLFPSKGPDNINSSNNIGGYFSDRGYRVATKAGVQDGELDNSTKTNGTQINKLRESQIKGLKSGSKKLHEFINEICRDLVSYYRVCQYYIPSKPRAPSTVNEMLHWLAGLYYTPMYDKLASKFARYFNVPQENGTTVIKPIEAAVPARRSGRMLRDLTIKEMSNLFNNITIRPYHILVTIQGHGHADGRYACDFLTNPDDLFYPSDTDQCLDMLVDKCLRLHEQIFFLFKLCYNGPDSSGWRDCWYGQGVGGSAWNCNTMQCPNQNGNQKQNQMCNQKCDQSVKCGLKSPLQSFLEDGLPGFLPHKFTKPGCKLECTVSNHKGLPCKTPMGFKDLCQIASRTGTGQSIKDVLDPFCGSRECSLSLICSYFVYLLRRPPQTLGDMFAFYYNILDHWCDEGGQAKHRREAFDDAIKRANFWDPSTELEITKIFSSKVHSRNKNSHLEGELFTLLSCDPKDAPSLPCGQYLQSMSDDTRLLYSKEYADNYLSWIVYITETFYDLLKKLYDDCCKKCNTQGTRCHAMSCVEGCKVNSYYKTQQHTSQPQQHNHQNECHSIVKCTNMHPTLYTYGFTFGSPYNLSGDNGLDNKRSCQDFCQALEKVCHGRSVLADLVINKIPAFLWEIRYKFVYTLVSLWSLSLLYLLHIAVVRLDVLRIRSHLKSLSSHRIAAQSLLAAARVKALGNIKYFSL